MRQFALLMCFAVACVAASPRLMKAGDPFMGSWTVNLTPTGDDANKPGVKAFAETFTFTGDTFSTKTMSAQGFGGAPYQEDVRAYGPATFTATQTSSTQGKLEWAGTTAGQDMTGTVVWTKPDGTVIHYDYTGNKAP
jgi:hypothetical protein